MQMLKIVNVQSAITTKLEELDMSPSDLGVDVQAGNAKRAKREGDRKEQEGNTKRAKGEPPSTPRKPPAGESSMDDIVGDPLDALDEVLGSTPNVKMVFVIVIAHVQAFIAHVHVHVNRSCIMHASCIYKNRSHIASTMIPSTSMTELAGPGS